MAPAVVAAGATTTQLNQAVAILRDNQAASASGDLVGMASIGLDLVIDQTIDTAEWVADKLPHDIFRWIVGALAKVHETFEALTGDTSQIGAHIRALMGAGQQVAAQEANAAGCRSAIGQIWQGQAFDSFSSRIQAVGRTTGAVAAVLTSDAERHLVLAGQLADAKRGVITLASELARELCAYVWVILRNLGLIIVGGVWTLAAAAVSGGISGGFRGAVNGFARGGLGGMVSGGFHGAVDGAKENVEALLRAAFDRFVQWAVGKVGQKLQQIAAFVRQYVDEMGTTLGQVADTGQRAHRAAALLRGQGDPGTNSDGPADGSFGDRATGSAPQAMDGDLIELNQALGDPNAKLPPGYSRATPQQLAEMGITPEVLTDENGYAAEVFTTKDGGVVVAFPGTGAGGGELAPDIVEDAVGGATVSPQTQQVLALSDAIEHSPYADQVVYTGHSLGGRHAAIAALNSGQPAVTYDSAGVSQTTLNYVAQRNGDDPAAMVAQANDQQIRRYYAGDDPLTAAQERFDQGIAESLPDAIGHPHALSDPYTHTPDRAKIPEPYQHGHDLSHAGELWEERHGHLRR